MIHDFRKKWKEDKGAAMAIVAVSLFLLMGVAAISADLAWFYLNASKVQRAADGAALAGVVYLPTQVGTANATALDIANRNGYDASASDVTVTSGVVPGSQNQLQVDIEHVLANILRQGHRL